MGGDLDRDGVGLDQTGGLLEEDWALWGLGVGFHWRLKEDLSVLAQHLMKLWHH